MRVYPVNLDTLTYEPPTPKQSYALWLLGYRYRDQVDLIRTRDQATRFIGDHISEYLEEHEHLKDLKVSWRREYLESLKDSRDYLSESPKRRYHGIDEESEQLYLDNSMYY